MKRITTRRILPLLLAGVLLLPACATYQGYHGASVGSAVGATAGALLSPHRPWRGAVIGGALGAIFGGALGEAAAAEQARYYQGPPPPPPQHQPGYGYSPGPGHSYREYSQYEWDGPGQQRGWRDYEW